MTGVRWDVHRAIKLYSDGWRPDQLEREFGLTWQAIRNQFRKLGVEIRPEQAPQYRPDVSNDEIMRLRDEEHLTRAAIASLVSMSMPGVVSRYRRAPRSQNWRQLLLKALKRNPEVEVAEVLRRHLRRTPTRLEITAARRAAHKLASTSEFRSGYRTVETERAADINWS